MPTKTMFTAATTSLLCLLFAIVITCRNDIITDLIDPTDEALSITNLFITEFVDNDALLDYVELKNFGDSTVYINDDFDIVRDEDRASIQFYLADNENSTNQKRRVGSGVPVAPGETVLVIGKTPSDAEISALRDLQSFTGKVFLSGESDTGLVSSTKYLNRAKAYLRDASIQAFVEKWSETPDPIDFASFIGTHSHSALLGSFNPYVHNLSETYAWTNGGSGIGTPGVINIGVIRDTVGPDLFILSPTSGGSVFTAGLHLSYSAADTISEIKTVRTTIGNGSISQSTNTTNTSEFYFSPSMFRLFTPGDRLQLTMHAWDALGNRSSTLVVNDLLFVASTDTTAPNIRILSPVSGLVQKDGLSIDYTASDNIAVARIYVVVHDGVNAHTNSTTDLTSFEITSNQLKDIDLGAITLSLYAEDAAGHIGSNSVALTLVNPPAILATEDFEDDAGYHTSISEFSDGSGDYFGRFPHITIGTAYDNFTQINGSGYFVAQDIDGEGASLPQTVSISNIDISGNSNLWLSIDIAEDDSGASEHWDTSDYFIVEARIDGGAFQKLLEIRGSARNTPPKEDTNNDGVGDGAEITQTFQTFKKSVFGSGSKMDIVISISIDSANEDIAFDNVMILGN